MTLSMIGKGCRRLFLFFVLPALLSSCSQTVQCWSREGLTRAYVDCQAERLTSPGKVPTLGYQLELVQANAYGLVGYLNRFGLPPLKGDVPVDAISEETHIRATATTLEGGQRLLLAPETVDFLTQELTEGHDVVLRAAGISITLDADSFPAGWNCEDSLANSSPLINYYIPGNE